MPPTEAYIQLQTDGTGKILRTVTQTISAQTEHMEVQVIGDPTTTANLLAVDSSGNITVNVTGTVTVSGTVTANAGTNLNTSLLALESGGNLATLAGGVSSSLYQVNVSKVAGATATAGDINNAAAITGSLDVAPVARYNATQPTLTDTRYNLLQLSSRGELLVTPGTTGFPVSFGSAQHVIVDSGTITAVTAITNALPSGSNVIGHVITDTNSVTNATLTAETTKVIGVVRTSDGAGNLLTSNSTTYTAKFGLDSNLLGTLGTAFSTAGKVDVKAADGDVFVRSNAASTFPVNVGTWIGSSAPTVGQKAMTSSLPVVLASDQASIPVAATLTAETTKVVGTVRVLGNGGATLDSVVGAGTAPTNQVVVGALYNSTEISPSTGQAFALQADSKGRLRNVLMDAAGNTRGANVDANNNLGVVLAAETTKVLGVVRTADGSGGLLTSTGNALDINLKTSSITLPVSLTSTTITSIVPGVAATSLGKAEDAVHADGDVGVMMLAVRKNTAVSLAGADGDYQPPITNTRGATWVSIEDGAGGQITSFGGGTQYTEGDVDSTVTGTAVMWKDASNVIAVASATKPLPVNIITGAGAGGTASIDNTSFVVNSSLGTPIMGWVDETRPDNNLVTEEYVGAVRMSPRRSLYTELRDSWGGSQSGAKVNTEGALNSSLDSVTTDLLQEMVLELRSMRLMQMATITESGAYKEADFDPAFFADGDTSWGDAVLAP